MILNRGIYARRSAKFAPQNAMMAPTQSAATPARSPAKLGTALGADAACPAAASISTPTPIINCRMRTEILPETETLISDAVK